jgi:hypothetical protein
VNKKEERRFVNKKEERVTLESFAKEVEDLCLYRRAGRAKADYYFGQRAARLKETWRVSDDEARKRYPTWPSVCVDLQVPRREVDKLIRVVGFFSLLNCKTIGMERAKRLANLRNAEDRDAWMNYLTLETVPAGVVSFAVTAVNRGDSREPADVVQSVREVKGCTTPGPCKVRDLELLKRELFEGHSSEEIKAFNWWLNLIPEYRADLFGRLAQEKAPEKKANRVA